MQRFQQSDVLCLIIKVESGCLERVREHQVSLERCALFHGGLSVWLAARLYKEFQLADDASSLAIEGLALEVMADLSRRQPKALMRFLPIVEINKCFSRCEPSATIQPGTN